jgi:hypothetical protein
VVAVPRRRPAPVASNRNAAREQIPLDGDDAFRDYAA